MVRHHRSVQYPHKGMRAHWPPLCSALLHPNHCGFVLLNILTSTKNTLKDTLQYPPFALEFMKNTSTTQQEFQNMWSFDHRIDFDNFCAIDKGSLRIRKTLEAWHTSAIKHVDNNSMPIPNQYSILFLKQSPNLHVYALLLFFLLFLSRLFCIYFIILHSIFICRRL